MPSDKRCQLPADPGLVIGLHQHIMQHWEENSYCCNSSHRDPAETDKTHVTTAAVLWNNAGITQHMTDQWPTCNSGMQLITRQPTLSIITNKLLQLCHDTMQKYLSLILTTYHHHHSTIVLQHSGLHFLHKPMLYTTNQSRLSYQYNCLTLLVHAQCFSVPHSVDVIANLQLPLSTLIYYEWI